MKAATSVYTSKDIQFQHQETTRVVTPTNIFHRTILSKWPRDAKSQNKFFSLATICVGYRLKLGNGQHCCYSCYCLDMVLVRVSCFCSGHTEIRDGFARVLMSKCGRKNEAASPRACTRSSAHVHPWHPKVWRHPSHHLQDAELSTRDTHWATPDETPKSPAKLCLKPPTGHSVTSQRKLCSSHDLQQLDVNKHPRLVQGLELKQPKSAVFSKSILSNDLSSPWAPSPGLSNRRPLPPFLLLLSRRL